MSENMAVVKEIIKTLLESSETLVWETYRKNLLSNKKIPPKDWANLLKIVRTRELYKILKLQMTAKEARLLGSALARSKLNHLEDIVDLILQKEDLCTPILLKSVLEKKNKFDMSSVQEYLKKMVTHPIQLVHLEILKVVNENYPFLIDEQILDFCRTNDHEICQTILATKEMEID